jgi:hypothetical protein
MKCIKLIFFKDKTFELLIMRASIFRELKVVKLVGNRELKKPKSGLKK